MAVLLENNAAGRLALNIDTTQTTITLQSGNGSLFPNPSAGDWFPLTIVGVEGDFEIVHCTSRTGDNLTVTRGAEGTQAREFDAGNIVELRLTKAVIDDVKLSTVPSGVISMWSGAIDNIPVGWALCNGSNGTPNLLNRFVVGAGATYSVGNTGGSDSVALSVSHMPSHNHGGSTGNTSPGTSSAGSHNHSGTANSAGNHSHTVVARSANGSTNSIRRANDGGSGYNIGGAALAAGAHTHSLSINSNGAHTHTVNSHSHSISSQGGGAAHENRPPYYALAYIMKL